MLTFEQIIGQVERAYDCQEDTPDNESIKCNRGKLNLCKYNHSSVLLPLGVTALTCLRDEIAFGDTYPFSVKGVDLGTQQQNECEEVEEQQRNHHQPYLP